MKRAPALTPDEYEAMRQTEIEFDLRRTGTVQQRLARAIKARQQQVAKDRAELARLEKEGT